MSGGPPAPAWTRRFLDFWAQAPAPIVYAPERAAWTAPCPGCRDDSDWWSSMTTSGLKYQITCPRCGTDEWTVREGTS